MSASRAAAVQKRSDEDFRMLATTLGADPFVGRLLTGRVESGRLKVGLTGTMADPAGWSALLREVSIGLKAVK